jgi:thiol-disulfide isomerase/thioredoxin
MNRIFLSLLLLNALPAFSNGTDSAFTVKGYLAGEQQTKKVYLSYDQHVDSTILNKGHFEFKGFVREPVNASVWLEEKTRPGFGNDNRISFQLDPAEVRITSMRSLQGAIVNGGPTESEQQIYNKLVEPSELQRNILLNRKYINRDNEDSLMAIAKETSLLNEEEAKLAVDFVARFPDSYVSFELMKGYSYAINPEQLEPMLNALNPGFKKSPEVAAITRRLAIVKLSWIGMPALEFTQNDENGKPVTLKSFRGKYVMIDFWASWCGWCRIEHPTLIKAYNKYKDKGFTLLSVSLDDAKDKDKWIAAIKKDGLPWQQVCDLKGRDNEVAKMYGIKGIPQSVIVDPDGKIVARNLRGDELLLKLEELFGK